ncbi:MAG: PTS sugar transporter subunit IIA [Coriobacteriales bacterium]|nr:PTS sugar transporter subunit IIA [Coriobacteriales bacterium]
MTGADSQLFSPDFVFFDIDASDRHDLFRQLEQRLQPLGVITPDWLQKISDREDRYATGLQTPTIGIAIPHADGCVTKPYIAIVKPVHPVRFDAMAGVGGPVDASLIVNLGIVRAGGQVEALQNLMNVFMDDDAVADIMRQNTPQGMVSTVLKYFS